PLFSLFNHSCEPNAHWSDVNNSSKLIITAKRDVAQGEELFVSYDDLQDCSLEERQSVLNHWFSGACHCTRCERERRAFENSMADSRSNSSSGTSFESSNAGSAPTSASTESFDLDSLHDWQCEERPSSAAK
ncbi:hypothetical protein LTS18_006894, partial [Coniosporium uncinatum]